MPIFPFELLPVYNPVCAINHRPRYLSLIWGMMKSSQKSNHPNLVLLYCCNYLEVFSLLYFGREGMIIYSQKTKVFWPSYSEALSKAHFVPIRYKCGNISWCGLCAIKY